VSGDRRAAMALLAGRWHQLMHWAPGQGQAHVVGLVLLSMARWSRGQGTAAAGSPLCILDLFYKLPNTMHI
jgi:hypothetical protein